MSLKMLYFAKTILLTLSNTNLSKSDRRKWKKILKMTPYVIIFKGDQNLEILRKVRNAKVLIGRKQKRRWIL